MTRIVKLTPPSGVGGADIKLNAQRVDYSVRNEIEADQRPNAAECRQAQMHSSVCLLTITGVCIAENGNTALQNLEALITAAYKWWESISIMDQSTYPKVTWRGETDEYMLIQRFACTDRAELDADEFDYIMTLAIDTAPTGRS